MHTIKAVVILLSLCFEGQEYKKVECREQSQNPLHNLCVVSWCEGSLAGTTPALCALPCLVLTQMIGIKQSAQRAPVSHLPLTASLRLVNTGSQVLSSEGDQDQPCEGALDLQQEKGLDLCDLYESILTDLLSSKTPTNPKQSN